MQITIYIDEYGYEVEQSNSTYKVVLTGSYSYSHYFKEWIYKIDKRKSNVPLSYFRSDKKYFESQL